MEEVKFWNVKEFTYRIENDDTITSGYDEKIKSVLSKLNNIKDEISLYEKLIVLSDSEMKNAKSKDDYNTLVSDKKYFTNILSNYKNMLVGFGTTLNQLYYKKSKLNKLLSSIHYYNENINNINEIREQYNYDIIYDEKNIDELKLISDFKSKLYNIIYFDYSDINMSIDINMLKKEYNSLSDIENYYKIEHKEQERIKTDEDYKVTDYSGFIFENNLDKAKDNSQVNIEGDLDYIAYCDGIYGKKRKIHKIKRIKKASKFSKIKNSLKKNIGRVLAGLLVGVTMIGISTITTGFDVRINSNDTFKMVATVDSANDVSSKIEETTVAPNNKNIKKQEINVNNKDVSSKEEKQKKVNTNNVNTEITLGTKVSASSDIYINATDAYNKDNKLTPTYPISDGREVSLIYYKNNDGDTVLVCKDNKDRINELKNLKYEVVAYCLDNTTHNVVEGWYNKDDIKVLVK